MPSYIPAGGAPAKEQAPICTPMLYVGTVAPENFVFLRGETLGSAISGANHADDEFEDAFNLIAGASPNTGTEDWTLSETVVLPDMRGRFPLGLDTAALNRINSASAKVLGGNAGVDEITLLQANLPNITRTTNTTGNHNHSGSTNTTGSHTHRIRWPGSNLGNWNIFDFSFSNTQWATGRIEAAGNHAHTLSINNNGNHSHTLSLGGSNSPVFTAPPFTAFNFIMRVK